MGDLADLGRDGDARQEHIVSVLVDAFDELIEADPKAFRRKFRKMAADPFAFYRGSACLFYADVAELEDPWVDERTGRVWIQGDLHAENYGTYMDAAGVLVFDVNDFDEAYLGHYTWDLQRMAASLALLGFRKALSDATIRELIETYARAYVEKVRLFATGDVDDDFRLTLDNTEGRCATCCSRRGSRRGPNCSTDDRGRRRRPPVRGGPGRARARADEEDAVLDAYEEYLDTIPEAKRQHSVSYAVKDIVGRSGFGIGCAGLRAYNLLVEGRTQALENDVVLSMKQAQRAAPTGRRDERIRAYFEHEGHRTAVSQRALQAHADPWVGWCELDGEGQLIKELSPYEADLDWDASPSWTRYPAAARPRPGDGQGPLRLGRGLASSRWWTSRPRTRSSRRRRRGRGVRAATSPSSARTTASSPARITAASSTRSATARSPAWTPDPASGTSAPAWAWASGTRRGPTRRARRAARWGPWRPPARGSGRGAAASMRACGCRARARGAGAS